MDFKALGLSETTIKAINEAGITTPTTVQVDVIPSVLAGKDVFAIAPTGCGKTCSYVFPLIEIMSRREAQNILIITAGSKQSVIVSDRFAVFNKYHEVTETTLTEGEEEVDKEANVIIAAPNLLLDLVKEEKVDLSNINILVVDDINLIKKLHQLKNLEQILPELPAEKQNIVFTNRRSKETQEILDKILQTPEEIKVNKDKEQEAVHPERETDEEIKSETKEAEINSISTTAETEKNVNSDVENKNEKKKNKREERRKGKNVDDNTSVKNNKKDKNNRNENEDREERDSEALSLVRKYHTFGRRTPNFLLTKIELAEDDQ